MEAVRCAAGDLIGETSFATEVESSASTVVCDGRLNFPSESAGAKTIRGHPFVET